MFSSIISSNNLSILWPTKLLYNLSIVIYITSIQRDKATGEITGVYVCDSGARGSSSAVLVPVEKMTYALENNHVQPANFFGVGGMKIFRDLIYLMQGMMKADHRFFKSHGQYDFPQKKKGMLLAMYFVGWMMSNKKIQKMAGSKMTEGILMPYKKVLEKVKNNPDE